MTTRSAPCVGCGAGFALEPNEVAPTAVHRYLESSPECWRAYGVVLAREYEDPAYFAVHRMTVDTYAVQHPGRPEPQTIQSVCVHLIALCLVVEQGAAAEHALRRIRAAVERTERYRWLTPPRSMGALTVADVLAARGPDEHAHVVRRWAESAWQAWHEHHALVRSWL